MEATKDLLESWLEKVLEEDEMEAKEEKKWPIISLDTETRKVLWDLSLKICHRKRGLPGAACCLLERYIAKAYQQYTIDQEGEGNPFNFKMEMYSKIEVVMASCIQLTSKMNSSCNTARPSEIAKVLAENGVDVSVNEVIYWEYKVFQTLDFMIPLWNTVDTATLLTRIMGISNVKYRSLTMVVDIVAVGQYDLEQRMLLTDEKGPQKIRRLAIAAGCVAALCSIYKITCKEDPITHLGRITKTSRDYLQKLRNEIIVCVGETDYIGLNRPKTSRQR